MFLLCGSSFFLFGRPLLPPLLAALAFHFLLQMVEPLFADDALRNARVGHPLQGFKMGVVGDGIEMQMGRQFGIFAVLPVGLHALVCELFAAWLFIKLFDEFLFGDPDFDAGIDGAAFLIFMLAEDAFGVIDAALSLGAGGEQLSPHEDLLLRSRLDPEVLVGS